MELSIKQQIVEQIKKSKNILITTHISPDGDALGSMLALFMVLKKLDKNVTVVSPNDLPIVFEFLPKITCITDKFDGVKDFIMTLDLTNVKVDKLGYKQDQAKNKLEVVITPKSGNFSPEDVAFSYGVNKYDLIFVLDAPDLDRLGSIYDNNTDLFYETPIINIDHHPGNDHFGKINWVDLTATSTSEILVSLIESLSREKQLLDTDIATCLLTGITTDTSSFQNTNTTPKSLTIAAQMVAAGARQQEIIQKIYKTKKFSTLKLWGIVLSKVAQEPENFVHSNVTKDDFIQAKAMESETQGVIDELLKTVPGIDFALLLTEKGNEVHGSLRARKKNISVSKIAKLFGGGGHEQAAAFQLKNTSLEESKQEIISKIQAYQQEMLRSVKGTSKYKQQLEMPDE